MKRSDWSDLGHVPNCHQSWCQHLDRDLGTGATLKRSQNVVNNRKRIDGLAANVNDQNINDYRFYGPMSLGAWLYIHTLFFTINQGRAPPQSSTTTNDAVEFPELGEIAEVSTLRVQWVRLSLEKPPSWSWSFPSRKGSTAQILN